MHRQLVEMLEVQIIEPSDSPWFSLVVLVAKPDCTQRFCVDYRALNSVTKRDLNPLPRCDDILESLSGAQWFSHLHLLRGYWQIDVTEQDQEKTAFATPNGLSNSANRVSALYQCTCLFYEGYAPYLKGFTLARLSSVSR